MGNLSEDSDTSDEDYVPAGNASDAPSEVDSDGDPEDALPEAEVLGKRGKKKQNKKPSKRRRKAAGSRDDAETKEEVAQDTVVNEVEQKKKADSLWADFLSDANTKPKGRASRVVDEPERSVTRVVKPDAKLTETKKITVTQIFDFAGEEVKVTKEVEANSVEARLLPKPSGSSAQTSKPVLGRSRGGGGGGGGGMSSVLSQMGKKQKLSTLEKSKLDWDKFKKEEDIDDEIQRHNKGKDGYLDRQDFLERADLRRFEIEKEIRTVQRNNRMT